MSSNRQLTIFDIDVEQENKHPISEVIYSNEMNVIKIESFLYMREAWRYERNHVHVVTSTVALLQGCMVYFKDFFQYPFLYIFDNMTQAFEFYISKLIKLHTDAGSGQLKIQLDVHHDFEDMHYCGGNEYGCSRYKKLNK